MAYNVVLRRNGAKVGHFGPFTTKKQAIAQGQVLADDAARDVVVSVEPQRKKATTKRKRTNTRRTRVKQRKAPSLLHPTREQNEQFIKDHTPTIARLSQAGFKFDELYTGFSMTRNGVELQISPLYTRLIIDDRISDYDHRNPDTPPLHLIVKYAIERANKRRSNPGRGTFKSKTYAYYTVANGKLTSGHGSPTGTPSAKRKARAEAKKRASRPENVMTAKQAQKYLGGRSLTSSASWHNQPRKNPARTRSNPASKAILKRIDLANRWIAFARKHGIQGIDTSSTWTSTITYTHPIQVSAAKNRATVKYTEGYAPGRKQSESYNLNDTDSFSDRGVSALRQTINEQIIRPIKRGAKDEGKTIPASLR